MKGILLAHVRTPAGMVPYWAVTGPDETIVRRGTQVAILSPHDTRCAVRQQDVVWVLEAVRGGYRPVPLDRVPSME